MSLRLPLSLLLLAALLGPVSAASAQAKDSDSANAVFFLVAAPGLQDPNFRETVVLVTQAEDGSNLGFIINRPGHAR